MNGSANLASNHSVSLMGGRLFVNRYALARPPRPYPHSLFSADVDSVNDYASWPALTDRNFTDRHLPPADLGFINSLPNNTMTDPLNNHYGEVTALFRREAFKESRSSLLFATFAQWLTDSFLRTDFSDRRRNTSNHQIDMCQIYGLEESTTQLLREKKGGLLKSQEIDGEEYLPELFDAEGEVKDEFRELPYVRDGSYKTIINKFNDGEQRKKYYFATGLERGNTTPGYAALSTLFMREHNRICRNLQNCNRHWDDERLFQTARMIVIVLEIKIVIEEYISHIAGFDMGHIKLDHLFAETQSWYRTNWISIEFDLLYRWHALIPDQFTINDGKNGYVEQNYLPTRFILNNGPLIHHGLEGLLRGCSNAAAGKITLKNTPSFLYQAEYAALKMGRDFRLRPFNEYRKLFGLPAYKSFEQLTQDDSTMTQTLEQLYGNIDNLEFLVGLYAEKPSSERDLFGELMKTMVAYDAFTHALTNPLLSTHVLNKDNFTDYGMEVIRDTRCLDDLVRRNTRGHTAGAISMGFSPRE